MEEKSFKDLWSEFIILGWSGKENLGEEKRKFLEDIEINPQVYLRKWDNTWNIYYLPIATSLKIPAPWPSIWREFVVWGGAGMYELLIKTEPLDNINRFGIRMTQLVTHIERSLCGTSKDWFFDSLLPSVISIGTKDFREWVTEETEAKLNLKPWILRSSDNWNDTEI